MITVATIFIITIFKWRNKDRNSNCCRHKTHGLPWKLPWFSERGWEESRLLEIRFSVWRQDIGAAGVLLVYVILGNVKRKNMEMELIQFSLVWDVKILCKWRWKQGRHNKVFDWVLRVFVSVVCTDGKLFWFSYIIGANVAWLLNFLPFS